MSDQPLIKISFESADFSYLAKYFIEEELGLEVEYCDLNCYGENDKQKELHDKHTYEEVVAKVKKEDKNG